VITRGRVRPEFLSKHGPDALSDPVEWMSPFWPRMAEPGKFSVAQCTTNSNFKASLMHAGPGGTTYPNSPCSPSMKYKSSWGYKLLKASAHHHVLR
jgi:hypothetical protein